MTGVNMKPGQATCPGQAPLLTLHALLPGVGPSDYVPLIPTQSPFVSFFCTVLTQLHSYDLIL